MGVQTKNLGSLIVNFESIKKLQEILEEIYAQYGKMYKEIILHDTGEEEFDIIGYDPL